MGPCGIRPPRPRVAELVAISNGPSNSMSSGRRARCYLFLRALEIACPRGAELDAISKGLAIACPRVAELDAISKGP